MVCVHGIDVQEIIRASVTPDQNAIELKVPVLDVKLPKPAAPSEEKPPAPLTIVQTEENDVEEDDFSEDDWDAFQSFPVSANDDGDESKTENAPVDPNLVAEVSHTEDTFDDDDEGIQEHSEPKSVTSAENPEEIKEEVVSNAANVETSPESQPTSQESTTEVTEQCDIPSNDSTDKPQEDIEPREEQLEKIHEVHEKDTSIPGTEQVSGDHHLSDEETKGSVEEGEAEGADVLHKEHLLEQEASDSAVLKQSSSESDNNKPIGKRDDAEEADKNENKDCEQQQNNKDDCSPVE